VCIFMDNHGRFMRLAGTGTKQQQYDAKE